MGDPIGPGRDKRRRWEAHMRAAGRCPYCGRPIDWSTNRSRCAMHYWVRRLRLLKRSRAQRTNK